MVLKIAPLNGMEHDFGMRRKYYAENKIFHFAFLSNHMPVVDSRKSWSAGQQNQGNGQLMKISNDFKCENPPVQKKPDPEKRGAQA